MLLLVSVEGSKNPFPAVAAHETFQRKRERQPERRQNQLLAEVSVTPVRGRHLHLKGHGDNPGNGEGQCCAHLRS